MSQEVGSIKKINKIETPLAQLTKQKRKKMRISSIRDEKLNITTDTTDRQRIIGSTIHNYMAPNHKTSKKWRGSWTRTNYQNLAKKQ